MEIAGKFVQLYCNAIGNPKPEISWQIIDNEDENLVYDIENYPFIWVCFLSFFSSFFQTPIKYQRRFIIIS